MKSTSDVPSIDRSVDPITLEVIRHGLVSITDQIDANITRTAFSPYIYEYNDFAVGLAGADGELIAQCTGGMPPFVADSVGMAVRDGLADLRPRAAAPRRRRALQSRRGAGPASQQHGDVHADLRRAEPRHADRLLRHQRALDRHRRHHAALQRHFHGRAAAALDQAVVQGRADRGSLPHHREQHALSDRAARRHRGAACRLPARARSHAELWPTNTASRSF